MKKLEGLNSKKFEKFLKNELIDKINIVGGTYFNTTRSPGGVVVDKWNDSTGNDIHCSDGTNYDWAAYNNHITG